MQDATDDFNDWFDSLTDRDQKTLQACFDKMLEEIGDSASDWLDAIEDADLDFG